MSEASVPGFRLMTPEEIAEMDAAIHPSDLLCRCPDPDRVFDLEIVEGSPSLTCQTCGKSHDHDDSVELQTAAPIPVHVRFVPEHPNLGGWHGFNRCDCGWWFEISPAESAPSSDA